VGRPHAADQAAQRRNLLAWLEARLEADPRRGEVLARLGLEGRPAGRRPEAERLRTAREGLARLRPAGESWLRELLDRGHALAVHPEAAHLEGAGVLVQESPGRWRISPQYRPIVERILREQRRG
jgi:hypothetical protein